eukprot:TRINITY_DN2207_c0_g1_i1.p1 TRINITY_DN2207_c0_g1~~TRINITY_DN2207_c0_g1_i1.p1  ORF type:complete len:216 (-),score=54.15 TRINITY_DN2207_c0_g1_i1:75-680(-)
MSEGNGNQFVGLTDQRQKKLWAEAFIKDIDNEVAVRTQTMRSEAALMASRIQSTTRIWTLQLPKVVREMNVKEFAEVYNCDVNLVLKNADKIVPNSVLNPNATILSEKSNNQINNHALELGTITKPSPLSDNTQQNQPTENQENVDPSSKNQVPQPDPKVLNFLKEYFSDSKLTMDQRQDQAQAIQKQMTQLLRIWQTTSK